MRAVVFLVPGRVPTRAAGPDLGRRRGRPRRGRARSLDARARARRALLSWEEIEALRAARPLRVPEPHAAPRAHPHRAGARRLRHAAAPGRATTPSTSRWCATASATCSATRVAARHAAPRARRRARPTSCASSRTEASRARVRRRRGGGGRRCLLRASGLGGRRCARWPAPPRARPPRDARTSRRPPSAASSPRRARLIEERTGRPVVHLCYPWHVAGATARRLAAEAGYETAFCGKVAGVPLTRPGGDLRQIARLGEDYVELLPGKRSREPDGARSGASGGAASAARGRKMAAAEHEPPARRVGAAAETRCCCRCSRSTTCACCPARRSRSWSTGRPPSRPCSSPPAPATALLAAGAARAAAARALHAVGTIAGRARACTRCHRARAAHRARRRRRARASR